LPDGEGTELMAELREASPGFQTLVLAESRERTNFALAVKAGIVGVLPETAHPS
jgi:DNA-binding NarL/FixJ family response regulator